MMTTTPRLLTLTLAVLLTLPLAATAQAPASGEHSAHHPEPGQTAAPSETAAVQDLRQAMRARMAEIRATQDPERRRQLLEAQMKDMEAMLDAGRCPMPRGGMMGGRGGQGMMSGMQRGMGCGMMGGGMPRGLGGPEGAAADLARRLEALEKRVDLLQMLLQQQAR